MTAFVAGSTGATGRPPVAEPVRQGHRVTGMARSAAGTQALKAAAVAPACAAQNSRTARAQPREA